MEVAVSTHVVKEAYGGGGRGSRSAGTASLPVTRSFLYGAGKRRRANTHYRAFLMMMMMMMMLLLLLLLMMMMMMMMMTIFLYSATSKQCS